MTELGPETYDIWTLLDSVDLSAGTNGLTPAECRVSGLRKVNILVGPNNSGKSRILRWLFHAWNGEFDLAEDSLEFKQRSALLAVKDHVSSLMNESVYLPTLRPDQFDETWRRAGLTPCFGPVKPSFTTAWSSLEAAAGTLPSIAVMLSESQKRVAAAAEICRGPVPKWTQVSARRVYIPTLRTLRVLGEQDPLAARINQDRGWAHDMATRGGGSVWGWNTDQYEPPLFTGQGIYDLLRRMLLGSSDDRRAVREYEQWLSGHFFGGEEVTLIPMHNADYVIIQIGGRLERPVHELGDGIQAVILLTIRPFLSAEPTFFFVEEPELHLHPSLQRLVVEAYQDTDGPLARHCFWVTTHSNHMLDITLPKENVAHFKVSLVDEETQVVSAGASDFALLQSLGVSPSSVFMVQTCIWVEGPTDRLLFNALLAAHWDDAGYQESRPREDLEFGYVMYGGALIANYDVANEGEEVVTFSRVAGNAVLVLDSDDAATGSAKQERQERVKEMLGSRAELLRVREIENLVAPSVWWEVLKTAEIKRNPRAAGCFEEVPELPEVVSGPIGMWLAKLTPVDNGVEWAADSGTLAQKAYRWRNWVLPVLAQRGLAGFTAEAKSLAKRVADLISSPETEMAGMVRRRG